MEELLALFQIIPVSSGITRRAGILLQSYRHQGLAPMDALIADAALDYQVGLVTRNIKHFRIIEGLVVFDLPSD